MIFNKSKIFNIYYSNSILLFFNFIKFIFIIYFYNLLNSNLFIFYFLNYFLLNLFIIKFNIIFIFTIFN